MYTGTVLVVQPYTEPIGKTTNSILISTSYVKTPIKSYKTKQPRSPSYIYDTH